MKIPFQRKLDETFRSDRSLWIKMAGAAFVAAFCGLLGTGKLAEDVNWSEEILRPSTLGMMAVVGAAGAGAALLLSLKDVVRRRMGAGERVNPVLKLYLGMGVWSLVAWFPTAFLAGILPILATH